ncbi:type VII secretion system-associated protein [Streptomyces olivochromogenes]|uniref:type VII secretion system-associated protein n=1 Tax=Streptomyces olivochromogenes TaxID=1963 RepID=UPI0036D95C39
MVDPAWRGEGPPPVWSLVGEWRSGTGGEIEEWRANEEYRPSPAALGRPEPTDEVDEAVQRASTGYGPVEDVPRLLAAAEVGVLLGPTGGPLAARTPDGHPVIPVFTSADHLRPAELLASETEGRHTARHLGLRQRRPDEVAVHVRRNGARHG